MATMDLSINLQAIDNASANLDKVSTSIQNLGTHSQNTTNSINQLSSALQRLGSTSASIQNLSGIITSLNTSLSASSQTINSFNSSLNGSINHLNNFNANINNLSRNINNLSSNFATLSSRSSQLSQIIQSNITTFGLLNSSTQNTVNGFHQLQLELTQTSTLFANLRNNMSNFNQGLNQSHQGLGLFSGGLGQLSIAGIVVSEITQAFNVLKETLVEIPKIGLFHLAELEAGTLATAGGIRNSLTQITTDLNTGFSTIGTASIDQAIGKSTQLMRQLREEIRDSIVTYDEVMNVYRGVAPLAGAIGADLSQMATLSVKMSDAVRLLNLPANQQLQEIRSIVQGAIKPSSSTLAMAVGMSNTEVAKAKEQGRLIEYINEKMAGFLEASARNSDTLYGRFAMLKKSLVEISMISLEPLFVSAKDILKVANQNVSNFKKDEKNPNSEMGKIDGLSTNSEDIAHNIKYAFQSTISTIVKVTQLFEGQGETIKLLIQGYLAFKAVSIATSIAQMGMATAGGLLTRVSTGLFQSLSNGVTPLSQIKNGFSSVSASITNFHTQMTSATSVSQRIGIVGTSVASMGRGFSNAVMSGMTLVSNLVLLGTVATGTALALGAVDRNTGAFGGKVDGFVGWASNRLSALKNLMTDPFANTKEKMRFDVISEDNLNNQYKQQITKARESRNSSDWENVDKTNEDIIKNQIRKISEIERDKQKVIELLKNTSSKSPDYSKTKADLDKYENYLIEERKKLESINKQLTDNREEAKKSIQFETSVKQVTSLKYNFNDDQMKDLGRALDSMAKNGETEYLKKTESTLTNTIDTIISLKNKTNKTQEEAINLVSAEKQLMKVLGESDRGSLLFTGDDGKLSVDKLKQNRELFLTEVRKQNNSKSVLKSILGENYADKTELEIFKNYGAEAIKHIDQIRNAAKHLADTGQEVTLGKAMQEAFSNKVLKDAIDNIQELSKQKEDLTKDNASLMLEIHYMDQYGTSIKSTKEAQALLNLEKIKSLKLSDSNLKEKMLSEANAVLANARANQALNITLEARKEAEKVKDESSKLNFEISLMKRYGKSIGDTTLLMNELEVSQGKFSKASPLAKSMLLAESAVKTLTTSLKGLEDVFASIDEESQKLALMPVGDENSLDYKMKMADFEYNQKVKNLQKSANDSFDSFKKYQSQVDEEIAKNPNSVFNPTAINKQYNLDLKLSETSQTVLDNINKLIDTKSINVDLNVKGDGLNQAITNIDKLVNNARNNYSIPFSGSSSVPLFSATKEQQSQMIKSANTIEKWTELLAPAFAKVLSEEYKLTNEQIAKALPNLLVQTWVESRSKKGGISAIAYETFNIGGIKGKNPETGESKNWGTNEYNKNGSMYSIKDNFRVNRDGTEAVTAYLKFLKGSTRGYWNNALNANNIVEYGQLQHKAGYATDPKYLSEFVGTANKVLSTLDKMNQNNTLNPTVQNNNQATQVNSRIQEFINTVIPVLSQSMESHKIKSSMTDQISGKITDKSEWLLPIIDALSATSKNATKLESVIEKLFKDNNFVNAFKSSFSEKEFYAKIQNKLPIIAKQDLEAKYKKDFKDARVVEVNNTVNIDNKPKTTKQNTKKTDNKFDNKVSAENPTENTFDDSYVSKFEESISSKLKLDFENKLKDLRVEAYKYINENNKIIDEVVKETTSNFNKSFELEKLQKSIGLDEKAKIKLDIEYDNKAFDDRNSKLNANIKEFEAKIIELDALIADKQAILSDQEKETYALTRQRLLDGITETQSKIAQNDKAKQDKAKNKILEDTTKETQTAVDAIRNQFKNGFVEMIKSGKMDWNNFAKGLKDSIKGVFAEKLYKEFIDGFATSFANSIINPMFNLMTGLSQQLIAMFNGASIAGNSVSQVVSGSTGLGGNNLVQGSAQQGLSSAISNSISSALGSPISLLAKGVGTLAVATGSATLTSLGAGMAFGANMGFTEALTTGWSLITGGGSTAMGLGMMASPLGIIGGALSVASALGAFGSGPETRGSGIEGTLKLSQMNNKDIYNYRDVQTDGGWFGSDDHWVEETDLEKQSLDYINSISSKINTSLKSMMNQFEIKNVDLSNVQTNKFRIESYSDAGVKLTAEQVQTELQNKYKELTKLALTKVINDGASSLINDNNFNFVKTQFNQDANKYSSTQDYETLIKSATDLLNSSAYLSKSETQGAYRNLGLYVGENKSAVNLSDINNYKKDGEDYSTTLTNIEKTFQATTGVLKAFGDDVDSTFKGLGLSSLDARQKLVDEVGGIDAVNSAVDTVFNNMYNTKEKIDKLLQKSKDDVQVNLDKVGVSIDKFKDFNSFTDWLDTLDKNSQQFANGLKSINQVKSYFDQQDVKTKYNLQINIDQASFANATGINSNQTASNLTDYATAHGTTLSKMLESYNGLIGGQTEINAKINTISSTISEGLKSNFADYMTKNKISPISTQTDLIRTIKQLQTSQNLGILDKQGENFLGYLLSLSEEFKNLTDVTKTLKESMYNAKQGYQEAMINYRKALGLDTSDLEKSKTQGSVQYALDELKLSLEKYATNNNQLSPQFATGMSPEQFISAIYNNKALASDTKYQDLVTKIQTSLDKEDKSKDNYQTKINKEETRLKTDISSISSNYANLKNLNNEDLIFSLKDSGVPELKALADSISSSISLKNWSIDTQIAKLDTQLATTQPYVVTGDEYGNLITQDNTDAINALKSQIDDLKNQKLAIDINSQDFSAEINKTIDDLISKNNDKLKLSTEELAKLYPSLQQLLDKKSSVGTKSQSLVDGAINKNIQDIASKDTVQSQFAEMANLAQQDANKFLKNYNDGAYADFQKTIENDSQLSTSFANLLKAVTDSIKTSIANFKTIYKDLSNSLYNYGQAFNDKSLFGLKRDGLNFNVKSSEQILVKGGINTDYLKLAEAFNQYSRIQAQGNTASAEVYLKTFDQSIQDAILKLSNDEKLSEALKNWIDTSTELKTYVKQLADNDRKFAYDANKSSYSIANFGNDFAISKANLTNDKRNLDSYLSSYNLNYNTNYKSIDNSFANSKSKDWGETQRNDYLNLLQLQNDYANSVKSLFESQLQIVTDYVNQINSLKSLQTTVQDSIATTLNNGLLSDGQKIINQNVSKANEAFSKLNQSNTIDEFVNKANEFKSALEQQYQSQVDYLNKVKDLKTSFVNLRDDIQLTKASFINPITGTDNKESYYTQKYNQYLTEFNSATEVEDKLSIAQKLKEVINTRYQLELDNSKKQLDFVKGLRSYLDGLKINEYSPYSRDAKLAEAKTQFDNLITRAKNGDTEAQGKVSSQADAYLKLAQEYFASSQGYTNVYDYVNKAIEPLAGSKTIEQINTEINQKTLEIQQQAESRLSIIENLINTQIGSNDTEFSLTKQYREQVKSLQIQNINALNSLDTSISSRIADTNFKLDIENTRLDSVISELQKINGGSDVLVSAINKMSSDVLLSLSENTLSTVAKLDGVNASVKLVGSDTGSNINPEIQNLTQVTSTSVVDLGKLLNTNLLDITKYSSLANQLITDLNTTTSGLPIATALANDHKYTTLNTLLTQLQTATSLVGKETASGITPSISELQNINTLSKSILEQLNVSTQGVGTSTSLLLDPKFVNLKTTLELLKSSTDFVNTSVQKVGIDTGNQINPTLISTAGLRDQIASIESQNNTLTTQINSLFTQTATLNGIASMSSQADALNNQLLALIDKYNANVAELNTLQTKLNQQTTTPVTYNPPTVTIPTPTVTVPTTTVTNPTTTTPTPTTTKVNPNQAQIDSINSQLSSLWSQIFALPDSMAYNSQRDSLNAQIVSLQNQLQSLNSYDVGTSYVTHDQTAKIHKGEIIIDPASANALRKYGISMNVQSSSNQNNQSQNKYFDEIIKQLTIQNQELRYQTDSVQKSNSELKEEIQNLRKEMYEIKSKTRLASLG